MQHTYYIGMQLPKELVTSIEAVQNELFNEELMSKPLEPHITLLPPPAVERLEPEELARQVKVTAAALLPLSITLTEVDIYKDFAIAITVESDKIHALQRALVALLPPEAEAIYYPNPVFSPHVTLAHALHGKSFPAELASQFAAKLASRLPTTFTTTHLTLFQWVAPREYKDIVIK